MALVHYALCCRELGEDAADSPAQHEEFELSHCDNIQATGCPWHINLPPCVDYQAELDLIRRPRAGAMAAREAAE